MSFKMKTPSTHEGTQRHKKESKRYKELSVNREMDKHPASPAKDRIGGHGLDKEQLANATAHNDAHAAGKDPHGTKKTPTKFWATVAKVALGANKKRQAKKDEADKMKAEGIQQAMSRKL